jgi:hypothetical protein
MYCAPMSRIQLELAARCEIIEARNIWIPGYHRSVALRTESDAVDVGDCNAFYERCVESVESLS